MILPKFFMHDVFTDKLFYVTDKNLTEYLFHY